MPRLKHHTVVYVSPSQEAQLSCYACANISYHNCLQQRKLPGPFHLTECFENALEIILVGIIMVNVMSSYDIERLCWLCSFLLGNIYKQEEDKEIKDYTKKKWWRDSFLYCIIEGHSFVTLSRSKIKGQMWSETSSDQTKLNSMKGELFLFLTNLNTSFVPAFVDWFEFLPQILFILLYCWDIP